MPVYTIHDLVEFYHFEPLLDGIFNGGHPFSVLKIRHSGPSCRSDAWEIIRKTSSKFYWIYIEPSLRDPMLQRLEHLKQTLEPEDDEDDDGEEEDDDADLRAYPSTLMSCPICRQHFDNQETITTRGISNPQQPPHPLGGVQ